MSNERKTVWIWQPLMEGDSIANHPCWFDLDEAQKYLTDKYDSDLTFSFPENFIANVKSANAKLIGRLHLLNFYQEERKTIKIPICDMVIKLSEPRIGVTPWELPAYGAGTITSKLKDPCPCCGSIDCYRDCPSSLVTSLAGESECECKGRKTYNDRVYAMESLILAYACAGGDVENLAFIEAIETAHQVIGNNQIPRK